MRRWKQIERRKSKKFSVQKNEVKYLNEKIETIDRSLYCHEQYSRRNFLYIHNLKENEEKDTDKVVIEFFEKEIKEKLSANDRDRSHRLGKKTN